jgi:hypothetical protein
VSSPDSFGRVVFHLLPRAPLTLSSYTFSSLYLAGYIVDAAHIRMVETSGSYGLSAGQVATNEFTGLGPAAALGPVTAVAGDGTGTLTGFVDFGGGTADIPVSGSFAVGSNGVFVGTFTGLDTASDTVADNFTFYLVDDTRVVVIETDNTQLTLGYLELQQ